MVILASIYNDYARHLLALPPQASSFARSLDRLHYFVIGMTTVTSVGLFAIALLLFVRYRQKKSGDHGVDVKSGLLFEGLCVVVPLSFFLLWFVMGYHLYLKMEEPPADAMEVYVIAKQWMWKFTYADGPNSIGVLRVPVGRPVKLLMTSRDVIHSFFVPAFRVKKDVLPGRYTELWFKAVEPGRYEVLCAEYCGTEHSYMRAEVVAMPPEAFNAWLAQANSPAIAREDVGGTGPGVKIPGRARMAVEGERVAAQKGCLKCHSVDGTPHIGPTWLGLYHRRERLTDGSTILVDEPYMTESMMDPTLKIVEGFNPVMPTFQGQLSPGQAAAILEFIKSLRAPELQAMPSGGPIYAPASVP